LSEQPSVGGHGIIECGWKGILWREAIIDAQNARATERGQPPRQIAVKTGTSRYVTSAVKIKNVPVATRRRSRDVVGFDPAGFDRDRFGIARRTGNKAAKCIEVPTRGLNG
jgi:hypothetical protein